MKDDILYSPETAALLLAMTALQRTAGVGAREALDRSYDAWAEHGGGAWQFSELAALVDRLAAGRGDQA
ncbi:hypothetical protein FHR72_001593 [Mycolicibacterium iranicum]|uniref:Uncharacterized protein n=1 Tax=Mycolicibacterium iranicum TaxID=912594 RepID=A0A839Q6X6_MYCIR|nr:hypothetical protein [Mycolicibacterium iranicum]MBB2990125.1 hypothetical protein [Mycolicibacterium iranicum]